MSYPSVYSRGRQPKLLPALVAFAAAVTTVVTFAQPGDRSAFLGGAAPLSHPNFDIRTYKEDPFWQDKADAADFVRRRLALRRPGEAFVLFHSIMWQYMPAASKEGVRTALEQAGAEATAEAPIARLRMEPLGEASYATLSLTMWPGGETRRLAHCDYHGRWIEWQ